MSRTTKSPKPASRHAVIYVRVSSKEQEREGFSIPAQRKLLLDYATKEGLSVVREFEDIETAKTSGRAQFLEMVKCVGRTVPPPIILVEKVDRLYRNLTDVVRVDDLHTELHFVKEGTVHSDTSRSADKFMHGLRVLMAKQYIDNLSEEVKKGLTEKVAQGHWPSVAPVGYVNNLVSKRIEPDSGCAPFVVKLFETYAIGHVSLKELTRQAYGWGLRHPRSGRRMAKSEIHRILHNPLYAGDFIWKGTTYKGVHAPLVTRKLFDAVQDVFKSANRPRYTKHRHAFAGLVTCGRCGCAFTAETKKGQYVYYHCTSARGRCGNTPIREERLSQLFAEVVGRVRVPKQVAKAIAAELRRTRDGEDEFRRATLVRLQRRRDELTRKSDKAYDDRLSGVLSEEAYTRRAADWQNEQRTVERDIERTEQQKVDYVVTATRIIELAQTVTAQFVSQKPEEQARLLKCVLQNCTLDRGSLCPAYIKPFDLFAKGNETEDWLGRRDSNPNNLLQRQVSYR